MLAQEFFEFLYKQRDASAPAPVPGMPRSLGAEDFELLERIFPDCVCLDDLSLYVLTFTLFVEMRKSEKDTEGKKKYEGRLYAIDEGLFVKALGAMVPAAVWKKCNAAKADFKAAIEFVSEAVHQMNKKLHASAASAQKSNNTSSNASNEVFYLYPHFVNFIYNWCLKDHKAASSGGPQQQQQKKKDPVAAAAEAEAEKRERIDTALDLWKLLLYPASEESQQQQKQKQKHAPFSHYVSFLYFNDWLEFVQEAEGVFIKEHDISQDLFDQIEVFARTKTTVERYLVDCPSWPLAIDDFVAWMTKKQESSKA